MSLETFSPWRRPGAHTFTRNRDRVLPEVVERPSLEWTQAESPVKPRIRLTSANSRRHSVVQAAGFETQSVTPPNEEARIRETDEIATRKITDTVPLVEDAQPGEFFLGSDALVYVGDKHLGKPDSLGTLRANLKAMAQEGQYQLRSHTIVTEVPAEPENELQMSRFQLGTQIRLNEKAARKLGTRKGYRRYREEFNNFYDGKVSIDKVASGVCLLVLVSMGMVESLDGIKLDPKNPKDSLEAIYSSTFTAIMNVAPQALAYISRRLGETDEDVIWDNLNNLPEARALAEKAFERFQQRSLR